MLPYTRYKKSAGIPENVKLAAVSARASRQSEMWPARMPPITPPKSKSVDITPAVESDKYSPPTAGRKKKDGKPSVNVYNKI
jgi:hypothetical protein